MRELDCLRTFGLLLLGACNAQRGTPRIESAPIQSSAALTHAFDFAANMPPHFAAMFSMSWFGIRASDPQGAGPIPSYGNWTWGSSGCIAVNDPATCDTCVLRGQNNVCLQTGAPQRVIASRRRPLAGIYSASGRDAEGLSHIDLFLSQIRRACDDGAKLDAWSIQLLGTAPTSLHTASPSTNPEIAYQALLKFYQEADAAGMTGAVMAGNDTTYYFKWGSSIGLDCAANKAACVSAITQDVIDMAEMGANHLSGTKIAGKPVLFIYFDPADLVVSDWQTILDDARNTGGRDFYVIASIQGGIKDSTGADYFTVFDAASPWIALNWNSYSGADVRTHAESWFAGRHDPFFNSVGSYPGRVVFGGVAPGFDDYTMNWCSPQAERQLIADDPRDPDVVRGSIDYLVSKGTRGVILFTWDDWTEGTHWEPDVAGGTDTLLLMRQELGRLYGEPADAAADQSLVDRWNNYGQARDCSGGAAKHRPRST